MPVDDAEFIDLDQVRVVEDRDPLRRAFESLSERRVSRGVFGETLDDTDLLEAARTHKPSAISLGVGRAAQRI